ncbi:MAG: hypothetical protein KME23_06885 [Goleter apudmare HA4340-LM2]|nr:hypothetical protein [Goleter apudmare HA4340-LM2]
MITLILSGFWLNQTVLTEILDEQIPELEGRSNPRVVKKTRAKFPSKKPIHRTQTAKLQTLTFSVINTA